MMSCKSYNKLIAVANKMFVIMITIE